MIDTLKEHFPVLYEKELQEEIAEHGKLTEVKAGTVIMDIGRYIKTMPLLVKGSIKILREDEEGNELFLYYLGRGDTCAMSLTCCMEDKKSEIRAVAEEDCIIISIPVKYMDLWMKEYTSWKNFVMQTYRNRFEELLNTIDSIAFLKMDERLEKYLTDKHKATYSTTIKGTHQEIAYELNSSREVISRLLKQLEKQGKIKISRNMIELTGLV